MKNSKMKMKIQSRKGEISRRNLFTKRLQFLNVTTQDGPQLLQSSTVVQLQELDVWDGRHAVSGGEFFVVIHVAFQKDELREVSCDLGHDSTEANTRTTPGCVKVKDNDSINLPGDRTQRVVVAAEGFKIGRIRHFTGDGGGLVLD
jgi:hypothetical protein